LIYQNGQSSRSAEKSTKMKKITEFKSKAQSEIIKQIERIQKDFDEKMLKIESFKFEKFDNETPYLGTMDNKIFFTYSNHYRGNSATWMSVNSLHHPHVNYEDRGYIKGVVTDLMGYCLLSSVKRITHNTGIVLSIYFPKFKTSKHSEEYRAKSSEISNAACLQVQNECNRLESLISERIRDLTGCSLLHYIQSIKIAD
jgi:hypothetical protein